MPMQTTYNRPCHIARRLDVRSISRASLAILEAADALKTEEIGPTTPEGVQAKIEHKRFIESLGG